MTKNKSVALVALSFIAFISLGMPDGLLGVAWPGIREEFKIPLDAMGLLLVFGTAGYSLSSFFSGVLVRRLGIGGLLSLSCGATATTLLVYSLTPFWALFVLAAFLGGLGAGAIDAGINTYVAKNHSEQMMQWLHASFGVGITMGPIIMTLGLSLTSRWRVGYLVVCLFQATLAITFFFTRGLWKTAVTEDTEETPKESEASLGESLKKLSTLLGMVMFFIYTGVEIGLGLWVYSLLTLSRNIDPAIAGFITGSYWAMFTAGRILAGWYTRKMTVQKILYISLLSAIGGTILVLLNLGSWVTIAGIGLYGFAIAPVFPSLISDTENRVGTRHVANTIGMQIAAAGVGAAVVPSLAGVLARHFGLEVIPLYLLIALIVLLLCFVLSHRRSGM